MQVSLVELVQLSTNNLADAARKVSLEKEDGLSNTFSRKGKRDLVNYLLSMEAKVRHLPAEALLRLRKAEPADTIPPPDDVQETARIPHELWQHFEPQPTLSIISLYKDDLRAIYKRLVEQGVIIRGQMPPNKPGLIAALAGVPDGVLLSVLEPEARRKVIGKMAELGLQFLGVSQETSNSSVAAANMAEQRSSAPLPTPSPAQIEQVAAASVPVLGAIEAAPAQPSSGEPVLDVGAIEDRSTETAAPSTANGSLESLTITPGHWARLIEPRFPAGLGAKQLRSIVEKMTGAKPPSTLNTKRKLADEIVQHGPITLARLVEFEPGVEPIVKRILGNEEAPALEVHALENLTSQDMEPEGGIGSTMLGGEGPQVEGTLLASTADPHETSTVAAPVAEPDSSTPEPVQNSSVVEEPTDTPPAADGVPPPTARIPCDLWGEFKGTARAGTNILSKEEVGEIYKLLVRQNVIIERQTSSKEHYIAALAEVTDGVLLSTLKPKAQQKVIGKMGELGWQFLGVAQATNNSSGAAANMVEQRPSAQAPVLPPPPLENHVLDSMAALRDGALTPETPIATPESSYAPEPGQISRVNGEPAATSRRPTVRGMIRVLERRLSFRRRSGRQ